MPTIRIAGGTLVALMVAGCAGDPLGGVAPAAAPVANVIMTGRWVLSVPNAPPCGMNFSNTSSGQEGAIEPEGGCPGNFFTSRRWTLDKGALTIIDDRDEPLARFTFVNGRFEGQSAAETPVALMRNDDTAYK